MLPTQAQPGSRLAEGRGSVWGRCQGSKVVWSSRGQGTPKTEDVVNPIQTQEGGQKWFGLRRQPQCAASLNTRSSAGALGRLAPGGTTHVGDLVVSQADEATHLMKLTLWCKRQAKTKKTNR